MWGGLTSSTFPGMTTIFSLNLLDFTNSRQQMAILLASIAYTFRAPACTAKNERIPGDGEGEEEKKRMRKGEERKRRDLTGLIDSLKHM